MAPRVLAARQSSFLAGGARVITAARAIRDIIEGVEYVEADLTTPLEGAIRVWKDAGDTQPVYFINDTDVTTRS